MTGADVVLLLAGSPPDRTDRVARVAQYVDGMNAEVERLRRDNENLRNVIVKVKRGDAE